MKYLFHLNFESSVHFGSDEAGYEIEDVQGFAHSDTLFSAFINALASVRWQFKEKQWVDLLLSNSKEDKTNQLPFCFSSFGFVDFTDKKPVYYLPKPLHFPYKLFSQEHLDKFGKDFKRRHFISLNTFRKWQQGKLLDLEKIIHTERENFWSQEVRVQHLTDNQTLATQIYHTGQVFYPKQVKPFFIVDLDESNLSIDEFLVLLDVVKRNGLGGRRTSGSGIFDYLEDDWFCLNETSIFKEKNQNLQKVKKDFLDLFQFKSNAQYLFSVYYPNNVNQIEPVYYNLILRKGWLFSTSSHQQLKRKTCYMFSEGSVFSSLAEGKLVDVTPKDFKDHRVYRYGNPLTIPFNKEVL